MAKREDRESLLPTAELLRQFEEMRRSERFMRAMTANHLREDEAAFYCCLSEKQFKKFRQEMKIKPATRDGREMYRRADLDEAIERLPFAN